MGKTLNRLTKHPLPDFVGRRLDVVVGMAVVLAVVEVVMLLVVVVVAPWRLSTSSLPWLSTWLSWPADRKLGGSFAA